MFSLKDFDKSKAIHFVGIGGIGMSSIAEAMAKWGYTIQGSDAVESENVESLRRAQIKVFIGHTGPNVEGAGLIVVSSAVPPDNPELVAARKSGIPVIQRAQMLNAIMRLKKGIAISGTHGKTTTTAFIGTMLDVAGLNPTIVNGGVMNRYGSHNLIGEGEYFVAEVCEAFGNVQYFCPDMAVLLNVDPEHMEFYRNFDNLKGYFRKFLACVPNDGLIIVGYDNETALALGREHAGRVKLLTYGLNSGADITAENIKVEKDGQSFDAIIKGERLTGLKIPLFGRHNVQNALASLAIAHHLDIPPAKIREALLQYIGVKHRFTKVSANGIQIFDDYGHHPAEIEATLSMAKDVAGQGRVFAIWEPHRFSRITDLFDHFSRAFDLVEKVIVLPVFSAGESSAGMKNSYDLSAALGPRAIELFDFADIAPALKPLLKKGDVVVSLSAGNLKNWIYKLPELL